MAATIDDTAELGRRIPDHPPYSLMIGEAIRSLNEEQGSTESSLSEYIKANFDGLPWGHEKLLPYYLNKLVVQGEFVNGATDRYLLPGHDAKDEKTAPLSLTNIKDRGKFVRKKKFGTKHLQGLASPLIEPVIKDGNLDEDQYKSDVFDENNKRAASRNSKVITELMPNRCGGSPKRRQSLTGGSAVASDPIASSCNGFQNFKNLGSGSQILKKSSSQKEPSVLVQSEQSKNSKFDAFGSVHQKRGRPPKIREPQVIEDNAKDSASEPQVIEDRGATRMAQNQEDGSKHESKKLERPWKRKHQALKDGSKEAKVHAQDVHTMQLADPSSLCSLDDRAIKPKVTEDRGVPGMVQNQEDVSKQAPKKLGLPQKRKHQALKDGSKHANIHVEDDDTDDRAIEPHVTEFRGARRMVQNQEDGSKQVPKKHGLPRKIKYLSLGDCSKEAIVHVGDVDTLQLVNPSSLRTNDDTGNTDDKSKSVPKRRGRPPKKKSECVEMLQVTKPSSVHPTENRRNDSVSKILGRPLKSKKNSTPIGYPADLLHHIDPICKFKLQKRQKESDAMHKHHGRPSKIKLELVAKNYATETSRKCEEKNSTCVLKHRGRPPKPKLDLKVDMPPF